jgi:hypothetical protein
VGFFKTKKISELETNGETPIQKSVEKLSNNRERNVQLALPPILLTCFKSSTSEA